MSLHVNPALQQFLFPAKQTYQPKVLRGEEAQENEVISDKGEIQVTNRENTNQSQSKLVITS